ncbi:CHAT domain-containing protein, partial [bacterium]|nr:CHAT domain-containing protein [bacterium]
MINEDRREVLAQWQFLSKTANEDSLQKWVRDHYSPLMDIGLRLSEQATLYRYHGELQHAHSQLGTAREIGQILAGIANDTFLKKQVEFITTLNDKRLRFRAEACLAYARARNFLDEGDYEKAVGEYECTQKLAEKAGDAKLEIDAMVKLQWIKSFTDQNSVIELGKRISERARKIGYRRLLAHVFVAMADAYRSLGDDDMSLISLNKAISVSKAMSDMRALARSYYSQAEKFRLQGDYLKAEEACVYLSEIDKQQTYNGLVHLLQGQIHFYRGEYTPAERRYTLALEYFRLRRDRYNEASTLGNLSILKYTIGQFEIALELTQKALSLIATERFPRLAAILLNTLGQSYASLGKLDRAFEAYRQALEIYESQGNMHGLAALWISMGNLHFKNNDYDGARKSFAIAEKIATQIHIPYIRTASQIGLGRLLLRDSTIQAKEYFSSSLRNAKSIKEHDLIVEALYGLALSEYHLSNLESAGHQIDQAISAIEKTRREINTDSLRVSYFTTTQEIFDEAILMAFKQGKKRLAFHYSDRAQARALLDAWDVKTIENLDKTKFEFLQYRTLRLNELAKNIPEDAQVIEYRITPKVLIMWLIDRNRLVMREKKISSDQLAQSVELFLHSIGAAGINSFKTRVLNSGKQVYDENRRLGKRLYDHIIKPIADEIVPGKAIYIIADGVLHGIPFGALVTSDDRFFDEKYVWVKTPSLAALSQTPSTLDSETRERQNHLLMVGGDFPSFSREKKLF